MTRRFFPTDARRNEPDPPGAGLPAVATKARHPSPTPLLVTSVDPPEQSPECLAAKCQAGCPGSFELLVSMFEARIFHFLRRFVGNQHDAEDLTQDTFVKAFRNIHRYQPAQAFSTWLFTIAKRTALNHFRDHRPTEPLTAVNETSAESVDTSDPATTLANKDAMGSLWHLARKLNPKHHEALWLCYGEGFTVAETARIMDTNEIHVRVLLHRGRERLAKMLEHSTPA